MSLSSRNTMGLPCCPCSSGCCLSRGRGERRGRAPQSPSCCRSIVRGPWPYSHKAGMQQWGFSAHLVSAPSSPSGGADISEHLPQTPWPWDGQVESLRLLPSVWWCCLLGEVLRPQRAVQCCSPALCQRACKEQPGTLTQAQEAEQTGDKLN